LLRGGFRLSRDGGTTPTPWARVVVATTVRQCSCLRRLDSAAVALLSCPTFSSSWRPCPLCGPSPASSPLAPPGPASTECLCSDPDSTRLDRECPTVGGLGLHMVPPTLFRPLVVQIGNPTGWRSSFLAGGVVSCSSRSMLSSLASPLGLAGSGLDIVVTSATLPIAWGGECAAVLAVLCVTLRRCVEGADLFSFGRVTLVVVVVMQRKFCTRCAGS
jgi:hypothetical protein